MKHLLFLALLLPVVVMAQQYQNQGEIYSWGRNRGGVLGSGTTVTYGTIPDTNKPIKLTKEQWEVWNTKLFDTLRIDTIKVRILRDEGVNHFVVNSNGWTIMPLAYFQWAWKVQPITVGFIWCKPWYLEYDKSKRIPDNEVWEKPFIY